MQKKSVPASFLFALKKLSLNYDNKMDVAILLKRNDKIVKSKVQQYDPSIGSLILNQTLQFKTTINKYTNNQYQSKTLQLQVISRNPNNKEEKYSMSTNIELSQIVISDPVTKTYRVKGKTDSGTLLIECKANTEDSNEPKFKSSTSLESKTNQPTRQSPNTKIKSMQNIPRKKDKNIVISDQTSVNEYDPDQPPLKSNKRPQFISKSTRQLGTVIQQNQQQSAITENKSIKLASEDAKQFRSKPDQQLITSNNNLNNQVSKLKDQIKSLKLQLQQCKQKDTKNKRRIKQLDQKIQLLNMTEQKGQKGSQQIIKRLHEQIESKSKQLRAVSEQNDKLLKSKRKQQEQNSQLRKELNQAKIQKQKVLFQYKYASKKELPTRDTYDSAKDIQSLRLHYEQQIEELKLQLRQKTKLLTAVQPSSTTDLSSECFSRQCQQTKKQHQKQVKKLYKRIEELTNKLQTKQKLILSYEQVQDDRKNQSSKGNVQRQFQRWKAQRLMLEQQIQNLKNNSNSTFKNNKQLSNIQQQLVTYKVEKQNMTKELEGLRRNFGIVSKDKQKLDDKYNVIEKQLIDEKQKLIYILNSVQEIGGMAMFDQISKWIED